MNKFNIIEATSKIRNAIFGSGHSSLPGLMGIKTEDKQQQKNALIATIVFAHSAFLMR